MSFMSAISVISIMSIFIILSLSPPHIIIYNIYQSKDIKTLTGSESKVQMYRSVLTGVQFGVLEPCADVCGVPALSITPRP